MPFDFLRKKGKEGPKPAKGAPKPTARTLAGTPVPFDGLTEEWRLVGTMYLESRLSDALNKREAVAIADVKWAPIDGSADFSPVPGLKSVDPYDLIVVIAGEPPKSAMSDSEKAAARGQKTAYDVSLETPPLRIVGTVYLAPGMAPERLMDRSAEMFVPVVGGVAYLGDRVVSGDGADAILVNRFYLRGVTVTRGKEGDEPLSETPEWATRPRDGGTAAPRPQSPAPAVQSAAPRVQSPAPPRAAMPGPPPAWPSTDVPAAGATSAPPVQRSAAPSAPAPAPAAPPAPVVQSRPEPEWPAADRRPTPATPSRPDVEWPAADRPPDAPPAPIAVDQTAASKQPAELRDEEDAASDDSSPTSSAESPAPSSAKRDPGAKGWPTPESGCRPRRGGLPRS